MFAPNKHHWHGTGHKTRRWKSSYQKAIARGGDCLGSYAFLWGSKQEATATWFGLFTPEGESTAAVDVLEELWTGKSPANRAPHLAALHSKAAGAALKPGERFTAAAEVTDPDGHALAWHWTVAAVSAGRDQKGAEKTPPPMPAAVLKTIGETAEFRAPNQPGAYRVFLRVTDGHGHAATANFPFRVVR